MDPLLKQVLASHDVLFDDTAKNMELLNEHNLFLKDQHYFLSVADPIAIVVDKNLIRQCGTGWLDTLRATARILCEKELSVRSQCLA